MHKIKDDLKCILHCTKHTIFVNNVDIITFTKQISDMLF